MTRNCGARARKCQIKRVSSSRDATVQKSVLFATVSLSMSCLPPDPANARGIRCEIFRLTTPLMRAARTAFVSCAAAQKIVTGDCKGCPKPEDVAMKMLERCCSSRADHSSQCHGFDPSAIIAVVHLAYSSTSHKASVCVTMRLINGHPAHVAHPLVAAESTARYSSHLRPISLTPLHQPLTSSNFSFLLLCATKVCVPSCFLVLFG
jgi:hypothetical protein